MYTYIHIQTIPPVFFSTRASALESQTRSESINAFSAVLSTEGRVVELYSRFTKWQAWKQGSAAAAFLPESQQVAYPV